MRLNSIYIPFGGIFPALTSFLGSREDFAKHFPRIDQNTPYGQAHRGVSAIDRRIGNLHLIMHRLRVDSGVNLLPHEKYNIDFLYLPIDFETFFVWLRMIMDQVAFLTPLFYERQGILPIKSFNDQLEWFKKDKSGFDNKYRSYLVSNTHWFTEMRKIRDDALHRHFWSYVEMKGIGEIKVKRMRGNRLEEEIESLDKIIGQFYLYFVEFSKFYEQHFSKILKLRDKKFKFLGQHVEMVEEYFLSIKYFAKEAGGLLYKK